MAVNRTQACNHKSCSIKAIGKQWFWTYTYPDAKIEFDSLMLADKDRKADQPMLAQSMLRLDQYNVSLEYRAAVANASLHETEAELFYVIDGSATLVTGGTINVSDNCLDRHVEAGRGDTVAYHWHGEEGETRDITYAWLLERTARFAGALRGM